MALHGEVKVNHNTIGEWSAVRKEAVENSVHRYECVVEYRNIRGYLTKAEFNVEHAYGDGALMLASKVLSEAPKHLVSMGVDDASDFVSRHSGGR